jgi:hypothetical protein
MFIAAAEAGCVIAGAAWELEDAASRFGEAFGMGFQYAGDYAGGDCGSEIRRAARANYQDAFDCLKKFEDASFLEEMVRERMSDAGGG